MGAFHTRHVSIIAISIAMVCIFGYVLFILNVNHTSAIVRSLGGETIADRQSRSTPRFLVPIEAVFGNFARFDRLTKTLVPSTKEIVRLSDPTDLVPAVS